jgi:hypothetical protein
LLLIEARIKYDVASACIGKIGISFQKYSFQPEEECVKKILMLESKHAPTLYPSLFFNKKKRGKNYDA